MIIGSDAVKYKIAVSGMKFVDKPGRELNWDAFNDSFKNYEVPLMNFCNAIYLGHPFAPWMNGRRKAENFICAQHIAVDMDTRDYRSSPDALAEHPLVQQYGAILYPTPSSASTVPKSRVVFLLDRPIESAEGYRLALEVVYSLFDGADPACVDPARFFFGNGKLAQEHAADAIWLEKEPNLPVADLRLMARQYQANRKREAQPAPTRNEGAWHHEPGDKPSLDAIATLLDRVDPYAIDYAWWLKVIAALRHEFGDAAFAVAKRWSDRPGKEPLTETKWKSLRDKAARPATIATIFKVAQEYAR